MNDIILETRDLTKHYGGVHALQEVNFQLKRGEHVAIMGDNGAGKSTLERRAFMWKHIRLRQSSSSIPGVRT
ncbi:MAG: ATP-binding cassette domain-containing protein, partial [Roseibium sp.]|nr:ATP-binding cassette domain-containing protein [Roseibium sp.]